MSDISQYSIEYRVLASAWWHESDQSRHAMQEVRNKLRDKYDHEPPDPRYIRVWAEKLFTTGSVLDQSRSGRPTERGDNVSAVEEQVNENPRTSTRRISADLDIPRTTVRRILKVDLQMKPWKPTSVQFLSAEDHQNRVLCCTEILAKYRNPACYPHLFFSDECAIYSSGPSHNVVVWSKENPHFWEQVEQHPPMVMVWAAMSEQHLIGPFFVDGRITAPRYLHMLEEEFLPALRLRRLTRFCHFQQDGAPAHTALKTREFLNQHFPARWVGKFGPTPWPARSPDLTSCDNALWGIVKRCVIQQKTSSLADLKAAVISAFGEINSEMLRNIHARSFRRMQLCIDLGGLQVDPYD